MTTIGTFQLIKNEAPWVGPHVCRVLPWVDEMVFFDGNSNDGTRKILEYLRDNHPQGRKLKLYFGQDPKDLRDDYVRLFNQAMAMLDTDLAWFLHPDMWVINPDTIGDLRVAEGIAYRTEMYSIGGDPGGNFMLMEGRGRDWKNIYRIKNPDLGAYYHGWYGAADEDVYFKHITCDEHKFYGQNFDLYPYRVGGTRIQCIHFSDVRPLERRIGRMVKCLVNQGYSEEQAEAFAKAHPRVTLRDSQNMSFRGIACSCICDDYRVFLHSARHFERFSPRVGEMFGKEWLTFNINPPRPGITPWDVSEMEKKSPMGKIKEPNNA